MAADIAGELVEMLGAAAQPDARPVERGEGERRLRERQGRRVRRADLAQKPLALLEGRTRPAVRSSQGEGYSLHLDRGGSRRRPTMAEYIRSARYLQPPP